MSLRIAGRICAWSVTRTPHTRAMAGRRQHGEGSLYQRTSDGRWIATVNLGWQGGTRQRRVFTGPTPDAARAKRDTFLDRRRDGFTMPKGRPPTVAEWMLHWLHMIAKQKVAPTTWEGSYRSKVELHIAPYFERVPLPELDEEMLEAFHRHLEARGLSAATIVQAHRIMSRALKIAVARGRIARNPCSNVTPPAIDRDEPQPPTAQEVARIVARCGTWPNGARWLLAIATGIRQGEALALEWKDVQLAAPASVTISKSAAQVRGVRIVKAPKSRKSRRSVAIGPATVAALKAWRDGRPVASMLVFTNDRGQPVHPRADWADWSALLKDLNIRHYRPHDLRHGAATSLLEAGMDVRVVQEIMGHATPGFTQAAYQHVRPVLHQAAADAMDKIVRGR